MALTHEQFAQAIMGIAARTVGLVAWLMVAVLHMALLLAVLAAVWYWQMTPHDIAAGVSAVVPTWLASSTPGMLAFLGLPSLAALVGYAKLWHLLLRKLANRFVLKAL